MPSTRPARKSARTTPKKRSTARTLSAAHKRALAEGRTMSTTVDRYLRALNTPKRRGRKVSKATLTQRLAAAEARSRTATGINKVLAAEEMRELRNRIETMRAEETTDVKSLEAGFVRVAKRFGELRGITYGAWRDAGVSAAVLKRAGVPRTRG